MVVAKDAVAQGREVLLVEGWVGRGQGGEFGQEEEDGVALGLRERVQAAPVELGGAFAGPALGGGVVDLEEGRGVPFGDVGGWGGFGFGHDDWVLFVGWEKGGIVIDCMGM